MTFKAKFDLLFLDKNETQIEDEFKHYCELRSGKNFKMKLGPCANSLEIIYINADQTEQLFKTGFGEIYLGRYIIVINL